MYFTKYPHRSNFAYLTDYSVETGEAKTPNRTFKISLDSYEQKLKNNKVDSATLLDQDHLVHGELKDGTKYEVRFPDGYTATITRKIVAANVEPYCTQILPVAFAR